MLYVLLGCHAAVCVITCGSSSLIFTEVSYSIMNCELVFHSLALLLWNHLKPSPPFLLRRPCFFLLSTCLSPIKAEHLSYIPVIVHFCLSIRLLVGKTECTYCFEPQFPHAAASTGREKLVSFALWHQSEQKWRLPLILRST